MTTEEKMNSDKNTPRLLGAAFLIVFVANQVRLQLFILAYNLGNFLRRLCLPKAIKNWSLRSLQVKLIKMGEGTLHHARQIIFQLAQGGSAQRPIFCHSGADNQVMPVTRLSTP